jgi:intracellular sulfur oxidation DsrE/DsrF family protein
MEPKYRVLIHFDEADEKKQASVLRNVRNVLEDLGADQTQVELVAHGPGLDIFLDQSAVADGVEELQARGVIMAACRNTLRERNIAQERLLPGIQIVSSGIGELVRRQQEGWIYVHP